MMKKAQDKYDKQKEFFKIKSSEKYAFLKLYPTLFSSSSIIPQTYPNTLFYGASTTFSASGTVVGIWGYSTLTLPVKVPYIVSFTNANQIGGNMNAGVGVGITNSDYLQTPNTPNYAAGPGWNDTVMFNSRGTSSIWQVNVTSNNISQQSGNLGSNGNILTTPSNVLTIQEYIAGQVYVIMTAADGSVLVNWILVSNPWSDLKETRCIIFGVSGNGTPCTFGAQIIQTPGWLIGHNN